MKPAHGCPLSILLALLLVASAATGQLSTEATVRSVYDDNVNNNHLRIRDRITEASLGLGYDWETASSNTQGFYTAALNYFSTVPARTFHTHAFGITYSRLYDEESQTLLNMGSTYGVRFNRDDFTFYDNAQFSAYINIKHYFSEGIVGRASYSLRSVRFSELSDFNHTEHYGFIQGTFFFPTRTTLILEADLGTKVYRTANADSVLHAGPFGQGRRRVTTSSTPGVTQFTALARIGQPIMEGTGLSLTTAYQTNLQKESRYLSSDYGTISDDELFDDHYGYEGLRTSAMLTQLLPGDIQLRITGSLQHRNYPDRPAYDLAGNDVGGTREDKRGVFTIQIDKRFESLGAVLGLSWDYITNGSNDVFYDYTNNTAAVRLSFSY